MIVAMKRLSLILVTQEKQAFLSAIQKTGIFEIIRHQEKTNKSIEKKLELLGKVKRTVVELKRQKKKYKNFTTPVKQLPPEQVLVELDECYEQLTSISREIDRLEMEKKKLTPWGNFNMEEVKKLEDRQIKTRFFIMPAKKFKKFHAEELLCEVINQDDNLAHFIVVSHDKKMDHQKSQIGEPLTGETREELLKSIPLHKSSLPMEIKKIKEKIFKSIEAYEVNLPPNSLRSVIELLREKNKIREGIEGRIKTFIGYLDILTEFSVALGNSLQFEEAELYCDEDETGRLTLIEAWFPQAEEKKVVELLDTFTLRYSISEPQISENPPVKLKNQGWIRPFEFITKIFSLPSYFEMDPTPLFAPFFMLFFGLCIADIGYGILLLGVALVGLFKVDDNLKPAFKLGIILGAFCLVAGYWLNTFFGFYIYANPGIEKSIFHRDIPGDFLAPYIDESGKQVFPAMSFSLFIGFMQVSFAMLMHMVNKWKQHGIQYAFKPVSYLLLMYGSVIIAAHKNVLGFSTMKIGAFHIGELVQMASMNLAFGLLGAGFFLSLFLNNPDKKIWIRPPLAFWELYEFISSIVGDILSYLRLFALGLASGLLGEAYNTIAFLVLKGMDHSILGIFFFVVIIFTGHTLNVILAMIGAFVHSLRLTFVEFYKNLHFQGGGKPFTPFSMEK